MVTSKSRCTAVITLFFTLHVILWVCFFRTSFASAQCDAFIRKNENVHNIPRHLLRSIALVESGKTLKSGQKVAWPWTINVEGKGYAFASKQEAIQAVHNHRSKGATSIDVGCMQVNLKHHPRAFKSLDEAFDPQMNVAYATHFLTHLKGQQGSWRQAVAHYHSATPQLHTIYREAVQKVWHKLRIQEGNHTPILQEDSYTQFEKSKTTLLPFFRQRENNTPPLLDYGISKTVESGTKANLNTQKTTVSERVPHTLYTPPKNSSASDKTGRFFPISKSDNTTRTLAQHNNSGTFYPIKGAMRAHAQPKPYAKVTRRTYPIAARDGFFAITQ